MHPGLEDKALSFSSELGVALVDTVIQLPPSLRAQRDWLQVGDDSSYRKKLELYLDQLPAREPGLTLTDFYERRKSRIGEYPSQQTLTH